jgi:hypothetical protein
MKIRGRAARGTFALGHRDIWLRRKKIGRNQANTDFASGSAVNSLSRLTLSPT